MPTAPGRRRHPRTEQIIVRVQASGAKTFKQGTAVVSAEVFGCGRSVCGSETDSEAIQIQR
jgi:hypothetical protein